MWTVKIMSLLVALGVASASPLPKEGKSEQNSLDYQIDPQLLNYHLQQLLLEQQQAKQQLVQPQGQAQASQYSVSPSQYAVQDDNKYQQQLQDQLQQQLALQQALQAQIDRKTAQAAAVPTQAPQSNGLTISPYQDASVQYQSSGLQQYQYQSPAQYQVASPQQYQQYQVAGGGAEQQYQLPSDAQQYQTSVTPSAQQFPDSTAAHQYTQSALQHYRTSQSSLPQDPKQSLIGVAYSSAVDASKTQFTGYGIKYSF